MKIGVILNFRKYNQSIKCCEELLSSNVDKVIIVDNCSPNDSYKKIQKYFLRIKNVFVIRTEHNLGYAKGNNFGLRFAENRWGISNKNVIYIVNPDSIINEKNIRDISNFIYKKDNAGVVTVNLNNMVSNAWHHIKPWKIFFINFWLVRWLLLKVGIREGGFYKKNSNVESQPVDVILGAFFGINQKLFYEIGYFDEGTFLYYEEEILYFKLNELGYQNYLLNTSTFNHIGRGSTSLKKVQFKRINDRSRLYVLKKFYKVNNIYVLFTNLVNMVDDLLLMILRR